MRIFGAVRTILRFDSTNYKWWIQYAGEVCEKSRAPRLCAGRGGRLARCKFYFLSIKPYQFQLTTFCYFSINLAIL